MADPIETVRLGRPYWQCPECPFSGMNRDSVAAHMADHTPHPALEEALNPAPAEDPPEPPRSRKAKE